MVYKSPEHFWYSFFQQEVQSFSITHLPPDGALEAISQLREKQKQGIDINIADLAASVVINDGKGLQEIWEIAVEPNLVPVAGNYGSVGIIFASARAYSDNPDIARIAARYSAPQLAKYPKEIDPNQSVLKISESALNKVLKSLDPDPSGFSLIRMVYTPYFFSSMEKYGGPHFRISQALVIYGCRRYREVYRQLETMQAEEIPQ